MGSVSKEDTKKFISIFINRLDINAEENRNIISLMEKYFKRNNIECIVTSTEKIVYAYGKRVDKYLDYELSDKLKTLATDENFGGMRASYMEITNEVYVNSKYYCEPLETFGKLGLYVFFYRQSKSEEVLKLLV